MGAVGVPVGHTGGVGLAVLVAVAVRVGSSVAAGGGVAVRPTLVAVAVGMRVAVGAGVGVANSSVGSGVGRKTGVAVASLVLVGRGVAGGASVGVLVSAGSGVDVGMAGVAVGGLSTSRAVAVAEGSGKTAVGITPTVAGGLATRPGIVSANVTGCSSCSQATSSSSRPMPISAAPTYARTRANTRARPPDHLGFRTSPRASRSRVPQGCTTARQRNTWQQRLLWSLLNAVRLEHRVYVLYGG
jgi:hypothetical protein